MQYVSVLARLSRRLTTDADGAECRRAESRQTMPAIARQARRWDEEVGVELRFSAGRGHARAVALRLF